MQDATLVFGRKPVGKNINCHYLNILYKNFLFSVPSFSRIACFNTGNSFLPDVLGDFTQEVKQGRAQEVIGKCAELAFQKNYKFFALGYNGRCRSGPNARNEYHNMTTANEVKYCPNGIGIDKRIVVYTFGELPFVITGLFVVKFVNSMPLFFRTGGPIQRRRKMHFVYDLTSVQ